MEFNIDTAAQSFIDQHMTILNHRGDISPSVAKIYGEICEQIRTAYIAGALRMQFHYRNLMANSNWDGVTWTMRPEHSTAPRTKV